jgi:hypothetical protein
VSQLQPYDNGSGDDSAEVDPPERRRGGKSDRRRSDALRNVNWSIDTEGRIVYVRARGRFALQQIEAFRAALLMDPAFHADLVCIVDLRRTGEFPLGDLEHAAADLYRHAELLQFRRLALLAPDPPGDRPARVYARLIAGCGIPVKVFCDPLHALTWCDETEAPRHSHPVHVTGVEAAEEPARFLGGAA